MGIGYAAMIFMTYDYFKFGTKPTQDYIYVRFCFLLYQIRLSCAYFLPLRAIFLQDFGIEWRCRGGGGWAT